MVINYGVGADEAIACSPDVPYGITRPTKTENNNSNNKELIPSGNVLSKSSVGRIGPKQIVHKLDDLKKRTINTCATPPEGKGRQTVLDEKASPAAEGGTVTSCGWQPSFW